MSACLVRNPVACDTMTDEVEMIPTDSTGRISGTFFPKTQNRRNVFLLGAATTASFFALSTASVTERPRILPVSKEARQEYSVAQALQDLAERYESILFSYPAKVVDIERDVYGDPVAATLSVSVDGNDIAVKRSMREIDFEVHAGMHLIVDGVQRGGAKHLAFRVAQPLDLDAEQEALLKSLVAAFKPESHA